MAATTAFVAEEAGSPTGISHPHWIFTRALHAEGSDRSQSRAAKIFCPISNSRRAQAPSAPRSTDAFRMAAVTGLSECSSFEQPTLNAMIAPNSQPPPILGCRMSYP
jgi:hypothetical protein